MSVFDTMLAAADSACDRIFAEEFAFAPMREVRNGKPSADTGRVVIPSLQATFDDPGDPTETTQGMPAIQTSGPQISVLESCFPAGVRKPDRFLRIKTGKSYEVRRVSPDGVGRLNIILVELA